MVQKLSFVINIILLIAVVHLYTLQYGGTAPAEQEGSASGGSAGNALSDLKIAYVNNDTIQNRYAFIEDIYEDIGSERLKAQQQLRKKMQSFQQEYKQLQEEATYMTQEELEKAQQRIQQKQQRIQQQRQELSNNLMEKEQKLQEKLFKNIHSYLKDYNKEADYDMILSYSKGGQILIANDSLEITQEVLKGLNESYNAEKDTGKK